MKPKLALLFIAFPLIAILAAPPGQIRTTCTLEWQYPTNELSTNLLFKFYSTTNIALPVSQWPLLTNKIGTNMTITFPIDASQRFFVMTASNWFGESSFSNVAAVPAPPRSDVNLQIGP